MKLPRYLPSFCILSIGIGLFSGCGPKAAAPDSQAPRASSPVGTYRSYKASRTGVQPLEFDVRKDGTAFLVNETGNFELDGEILYFVSGGTRKFGFTRRGDELIGNGKLEGFRFARVGNSKEQQRLDQEIRIQTNLRMLVLLARQQHTGESIGAAIQGRKNTVPVYTVGDLNSCDFLKQLKPVDGEDYSRLAIQADGHGRLRLTTMSGLVVEHTY